MTGTEPGPQSGEPAETAGSAALTEPHAPTLRERLRPLELLGISGALGLFAGLITGFTTREWLLALIVLGIAFVVALVVLAMLALGDYDPPEAPGEKGVLGEKDERRAGEGRAHG